MSAAQQQMDDEDETGSGISAERLLSALRRRSRLTLFVWFIVTLVTVTIAKTLPPRFEAAAVIQIDPRRKAITGLEGQSDVRAELASIDGEVEIIRSRSILVRTIDILGLREDEEFAGAPFTRLLAIKFGLDRFLPPRPTALAAPAETNDPIASVIKGQPSHTVPERDDIAVALSERLKVSRVRTTLLIEVRVSSRDAAKAARIANTIAEVYLADQLDQKSRLAAAASSMLEQKLEALRSKVVEAERNVESYKAEHGIINAEGGSTVNEKQLSRLVEQAVNARNTSSEARARYELAQKLAHNGDANTSLADVLQSNTVRVLKEQLVATQKREAELSAKYGANHPEMRKVHAEVLETKRSLDAEVPRLIANLKNEADTAEERERQLNASLGELKARQVTNKDDSAELKQLESEAQTSKALFDALLTRYKQTSETRGLQLPDARIVEQADTPLYPASPKRKQIALIGLIGGLLAGIMAALAAELLTKGLARPEDVESVLDLTHLSSLPRVPRAAGDADDPAQAVRLVVADPIAPFTEAIRGVKREIDVRRTSRRARVILIVSSLPNEGSSVVASNLAHHYAIAGGNVLLIDGDLRRAGLSRELGGTRGLGLLEALSTPRQAEEAILRDATTGLHFLPAMGPAPVRLSSPELLGSARMHQTLDRLRAQFDTIIIDAPPLLPVLDGRILADHADQIVLVMTWRRTPKQMARRAIKTLGGNTAKILGVVVNEVDDDIIADAQGLASLRPAPIGRAA